MPKESEKPPISLSKQGRAADILQSEQVALAQHLTIGSSAPATSPIDSGNPLGWLAGNAPSFEQLINAGVAVAAGIRDERDQLLKELAATEEQVKDLHSHITKSVPDGCVPNVAGVSINELVSSCRAGFDAVLQLVSGLEGATKSAKKEIKELKGKLEEAGREYRKLDRQYSPLKGIREEKVAWEAEKLNLEKQLSGKNVQVEVLLQQQKEANTTLLKGLEAFWDTRKLFYEELYSGLRVEQGKNYTRLDSFRTASLEADVQILAKLGAIVKMDQEAREMAECPYDGADHQWLGISGEAVVANGSIARVLLPGWSYENRCIKPCLDLLEKKD
jgi:hypothetical protein